MSFTRGGLRSFKDRNKTPQEDNTSETPQFNQHSRNNQQDDRGSNNFRQDDRGNNSRPDDRGSNNLRPDDRGSNNFRSDDRGSRFNDDRGSQGGDSRSFAPSMNNGTSNGFGGVSGSDGGNSPDNNQEQQPAFGSRGNGGFGNFGNKSFGGENNGTSEFGQKSFGTGGFGSGSFNRGGHQNGGSRGGFGFGAESGGGSGGSAFGNFGGNGFSAGRGGGSSGFGGASRGGGGGGGSSGFGKRDNDSGSNFRSGGGGGRGNRQGYGEERGNGNRFQDDRGSFGGGRGNRSSGPPRENSNFSSGSGFASGANAAPFGATFASPNFGANHYEPKYVRPENKPSFTPVFEEAEDLLRNCQIDEDVYEKDAVVTKTGGPDIEVRYDEWSETPFCPEIIKNLEALKFKVPRNIQKVAMPAIVEGFDVVVQSETGSGKTATFMLPIVHKLEEQYKADAAQEGSPPSRLCRPSCIVFSPTRELARQLFDEAKKLCRGTSVRANVCYGDYSYRENLNSLRTVGCDILIGTIGRIHHFLTGNGREPELKSDSIKFVVFDEVDELLKDNNFCQLQSVCENKEMIPRDSRQHLFFSATYNQIHKNIVDNIGRPKQLITFRAQASGNKRITQEIKCIRSGDRKNFLISLFNKEMAENGKIEKTIVFVEKKRDADTLSLRLSEDHKCKSITMHADRTQQEREEHFAKFKQGEHQVLVATNVASRGLDVHDLNRVIIMELGNVDSDYVHRVGRTGRTHSGKAIVFFDPLGEADKKNAERIIQYLVEVDQEVPEFLRHCEDESYDPPYEEVEQIEDPQEKKEDAPPQNEEDNVEF